MSWGPICGLWPGRMRLIAAVADADGLLAGVEALPVCEEGEDGGWLSQAEGRFGPGIQLVVTAQVARQAPLCRVAVALGYRVWVAPTDLVHLVASAAWWRPTPRQLAAVLARLPRIRSARAVLRRLPQAPGPRQLRLF